MPMTPAHANLFSALGDAGHLLDGKVAAFSAAYIANQQTMTALETARSELNAAWTDFVTSDSTFETAILTPPPGYTPPS